MPLSLPHWNYGEDRDERIQRVHENFEELVSQTERVIRDSSVHEPSETLAEVTTSSTSYTALSGGPTITVPCRAGVMIAVLMDVEMKNTDPGALGEKAGIAANLDGGASVYVADETAAHAAYTRVLVPDGNNYPAGLLAVFPATSTSHTLTMMYKALLGTGVASFKNRRIWAWVL